MTGPVARAARSEPAVSAAGEVVVGQAARPHNAGAGVVVRRVLHRLLRRVHDRAHQPLGDGVRRLHRLIPGEVPLHCVRDDVRAAGRRLIRRQREHQLRVHQRELQAAEVAAQAALLAVLLVGDDRGIAHLAARGGDGQHAADGIRRLRRRFLFIEVPHIAVVGEAVSNRLRGIDHAAAADGEQKVNALFSAKLNTFTHK